MCTNLACFSTFYQSTIIPTLVNFLQILLLHGEPTSNYVVHPNNHLKVKYPLHIFFTYVQAVAQQDKSKSSYYEKRNGAAFPS